MSNRIIVLAILLPIILTVLSFIISRNKTFINGPIHKLSEKKPRWVIWLVFGIGWILIVLSFIVLANLRK
jgi:uncharacterized protein involved in cysteine biosynthesis